VDNIALIGILVGFAVGWVATLIVLLFMPSPRPPKPEYVERYNRDMENAVDEYLRHAKH
jgi:uncharacterized membrane protein YgaE (UPF0421/DUF939 family)